MPPGLPLGQKGAAYADVASANSTLNTLMPGRQKSWMTNTLVQPSPRRLRPQDSGPPQSRQPTVAAQQELSPQVPARPQLEPELQSQQTLRQPQQTPSTPANVLPSPAPSDEPSPAALSSYKDSPNPQSVSLAAVSRGRLNPAPTSLSSPTNPNSKALSPKAIGTEPAPPEHAVLGTLAEGVRSPLTMPPPNLPHGSQNGPSHGGATVLASSPSSPDVQSRSNYNGVQEHPNKRRRVAASSTSIAFGELAAAIDTRIAQIGGHDALTKDFEGPRFALLKDACAAGDLFYLHFHSLYCLWSHDARRLPPVFSQDLGATYRGFSIVETVLKKNSGFRNGNLMWCINFPQRPSRENNPEVVTKVAKFLQGLSQHWPTLSPACFNRHYPYLVHELLGQLQCYSVCMQNILFTACRRRLGIEDGPLGEQVQTLFRLDQKHHMDEQGSFRQVELVEDPQDIGRRNLIIRAYQQIWSNTQAAQKEKNEQRRQEQLSQKRDEQRRQQEYQRQAVMRQVTQQNLQREHMQQAAQPLQQQQQQMRNDQAVLIAASQQLQMANQIRLGQQQAQTHQVYTGSQQQMNPQWAQSQMPGAAASHAMQPPMDFDQFMQFEGQFDQLPQSSGAFSGLGSPTIPHNSSPPQQMRSQYNQPSPSFILSSNSSLSPTMPGADQVQYQYSMPLQQQPTHGQNQMRIGTWSASTAPTNVQIPQMTTVRTANSSMSPHLGGQQVWSHSQSRAAMQPQVVQQQMTQQQTRQQRMRQQSVQHQGQPHASQVMVQKTMQLKTPMVPPRGYVIDRSEQPHSHQEKKSLLMSLHQAHARSPDRTRVNGNADVRYYQSVRSLAVQPLRLVYYHEVNVEVSTEQFSRLCKPKTIPQLSGDKSNQTRASLLVREYDDDSLRFRVRCCRLRSENVPIQESEWVTKDTSWPDHIFIQVNEHKLTIRRGTHNGKDLPIELTDFLHAGTNKLRVAVPRAGPTAAGKEGIFFMAIEIIKISSHIALLRDIETNNRVDREQTLEKIRTRVNAAPDDEDEIAVIDRTGSTTRELSISLTDPFSASIFMTPARGATCTHLECFDLETWLNTRPAKQHIKCGHKDVCTCTKRLEPTEPDKWKCPICFEDARPSSLRIDSFLEGVRKQLEERNQLDVKSILVAAEGTWRPVEEPEDDDDEDSDGDGPAIGTRHNSSALRRSAPVEKGRTPVEVIELD